ncbi:MAG: hypothetical protein ACKVHE_06550 [Planctomycetales bacterium]|jgi:hypothetical protein
MMDSLASGDDGAMSIVQQLLCLPRFRTFAPDHHGTLFSTEWETLKVATSPKQSEWCGGRERRLGGCVATGDAVQQGNVDRWIKAPALLG